MGAGAGTFAVRARGAGTGTVRGAGGGGGEALEAVSGAQVKKIRGALKTEGLKQAVEALTADRAEVAAVLQGGR